ncbi:MAG: Fe-S oxidoreductase [Parcubacteria group bacterium Gr01-1014_38]|nr:MAG: Fe-S oxidoreductase [Parcubacteria group bacterium Gr01-1014_38]
MALPSGLPCEFDLMKHGFTMRGWDFSREEIAEAINAHRMLNPAMELGTNYCPWNCGFCFTEDPHNPEGDKRRLDDEMTPKKRLQLIDEAAALGTRSINFVGAGEPTIDPHFWKIIEQMASHSITPIIYTEGALRCTDRGFCQKLYDLGATVVLKMNSLEDEAYQNAIVAGPSGRKRPMAENYFRKRAEALRLLLNIGFADTTPTRLAFDTIICQQNREEVPRLHRYARQHNIFVLFVNYLPSGRSSDGVSDALTRAEQFAIFDDLARIDEREFELSHRSIFPYAGGTPCTIRGLGLYVKIRGEVYDCPGELQPLGDVQREPLMAIWERARPITRAFDGGCAPREHFWKTHGQQPDSLSLLVIQ